MPDTDFAGLRAVVEEAVVQPEFTAVERRSGRLRTRRRMTVAALATAVLAAGAVGFAIRDRDSALPEPAQPRPVGDVVSAQAGDPDHLYVTTRKACPEGQITVPDECRMQLYASDDGGRSWRRTILPQGADEYTVSVHGVGVLTAGRPLASGIQPHVSDDGGGTWRSLTAVAGAVEAVPSGGGSYGCAGSLRTGTPCRVTVIDPAAGQVAPLGTQPPIEVSQPYGFGPDAGLWVDGFDAGTRKPAAAWSRNGGRTWSTHTFAGEPAAAADATVPPIQLQTADGRTVYAVFSTDNGGSRVYRTGDGGATWARVSGEVAYTGWGLVAADGAHVVADDDNSGRYLASRGGGPYQPVELTGLPPVTMVSTSFPGGYLTTAESDRTAIYLSTDGYRWRRIPVT